MSATAYKRTRAAASTFELFGQVKGWAYNQAGDHPDCCLSYLEVQGHDHNLSTCHTADLYYYIIEGAGEFSVAGQRFAVAAADAILVPRGTEYGYRGTMKYVLFMAPAYTEGCETRTERTIDDV